MNVPYLSSPTTAYPAQASQRLPTLRSQARQTLQKGLYRTEAFVLVQNRRVWIVRRRCHHGLVGAAVTTTGVAIRNLALVVLGVWLMWDDKEDWPWPPARLRVPND